MKTIKIDLGRYKKNDSTIFTGRPMGLKVREKINLDKLDFEDDIVIFQIPQNTTSLNPSFYLGLLFKSYENLGITGFDEKYSFEFLTIDKNTKDVLLNNIADGKRYAISSLKPNWNSLFDNK